MLKILETQFVLPHPVALVLNYACLDFNFTSWMSPANLRVLQSEQSSGHIPGLAEQKDHYSHISPLSMVGSRKILRRRRSWRDAIRTLASPTAEKPLRTRRSTPAIKSAKSDRADPRGQHGDSVTVMDEEAGDMADAEDSADPNLVSEEEKSIEARVRFRPEVEQRASEKQEKDVQAEPQGTPKERVPLGTRLTMTSRTGYFQDRIISPSMVSLSRHILSDNLVVTVLMLFFRCEQWPFSISVLIVILTLAQTTTSRRSWHLATFLHSSHRF